MYQYENWSSDQRRPSDIAQKVERRICEHNVSGHYRLWVRIPGWPTKTTNSLSDKMLNRGLVC